MLTVSIGAIQLGYALGTWNTISLAYSKREGWNEDPLKIMAIQTITVGGIAGGSLCSGSVAQIGRFKSMMLGNLLLVLGTLISLIDDFGALCIGRFIYGVGAGSFSIFCPLYLNETAPIEISGPVGAATEFGISFGLFLVFGLGLVIGDPDEDDIDSF
jgi:MFS family permease